MKVQTMTRGKRLAMCVAAGLLAVAAPAWAVPLPNGGFETATLSGWQVVLSPSGGAVNLLPVHTDTGAGVTAGTGWTSWGAQGSSVFPVSRILGSGDNVFARVKTDGALNWVQLRRMVYVNPSWNPTMSMSFYWFWDSQDTISPPGQDEARGRVYDLNGNLVDVLFTRNDPLVVGDDDPLSYYGTPWTQVNYTFAQPGSYMLVFEIANGGDPSKDSFLGIDELVAPVPEPLTIAGVLAGLGGLAGYLRRRRAA